MVVCRWIPILTLAFAVSACSDFFNSRTNAPSLPTPPPAKAGANPFPPGYDPNTGNFSESKMLANIGLNVIAPLTREFRLQSELLHGEIKRLCASLAANGHDDGGETTAHAQAARALATKTQWSKTMLTYHTLSATAFGSALGPGSEGSKQIYGWPNFNACGVDLEVVKLKETGRGGQNLLYTLKGLGALEYLLFEPEGKTQCNPANPRHAPAFEWAKRPDLEKRRDRCRLAQVLALDLVMNADAAEAAWDPRGSNFIKSFIESTPTREAVNTLSDSLMQVEDVKDARLGAPLGLYRSCSNPRGKCPELSEHIWSGLGLKAMAARLKGFRMGFLGGEDPSSQAFGFDDDLRRLGRSDLVDRVLNGVDRAVQSVNIADGLGPFQEQVEKMSPNDCRATNETEPKVPACLAHIHVRQLSTVLRSELLVALALKSPPSHQGDND